jgi:hypothetical protein
VRTGVMVLGLPDSSTETQGARAPVGVGEGDGVDAVSWVEVEVDDSDSWDCRAKRGAGIVAADATVSSIIRHAVAGRAREDGTMVRGGMKVGIACLVGYKVKRA